MIRSIRHDVMVETLLDALQTERYVRAPLLQEIIGELSTSEAFEPACGSARRLLARLEAGTISDAELALGIAELRATVRAHAGS